jgi:hypothetical protein
METRESKKKAKIQNKKVEKKYLMYHLVSEVISGIYGVPAVASLFHLTISKVPASGTYLPESPLCRCRHDPSCPSCRHCRPLTPRWNVWSNSADGRTASQRRPRLDGEDGGHGT